MAERITIIINAQAEQAVKEFNAVSRDVSAMADKIGAVGMRMSAGLTLPLVAAGVAAGRLATQFDTEMTKIETLVGIARGTVDAWRRDVAAMAPELGRAPRELAEGLFVVTSAGERSAKALEILNAAGKAAAVGLGETKDIARAVTSAVQAYRTMGLTAADATDVLVATVREGNLEAASLASSLGRVLGPAAALGSSFADVGAFIAAFTRVGVSAEEAVTSLSAAMTLAIKPTKQAREAMLAAGYSVDEFRAAIRERGMNVALKEMLEATDANLDLIGQFIPNVRALRGILATAGAQGEQYAQITDSIRHSQGMLNEAFERASQDAGLKMAQAWASLKAAGVSMGGTLLPVIAELGDGVTLVGRALAGMAPWQKTAILGSRGWPQPSVPPRWVLPAS
ncbi:MAG: phage tail tape measure protein [Pseudomonadota bacterium]